jgi:MOSC domain-containing protein YiiM
MRVISVNVGLPQTVVWNGRTFRTSILKTPVPGPTRVRAGNLEGDKQSDRLRHGGTRKAVCVYPSEHYAFWRNELPGVDLPYGSFGENLTLEGWLEDVARIGDRLRIGSAEFAITQPRLPCIKLERRLGGHDMIRRVLKSRRTGYYLSVLREGYVEPGDVVHVTRAGDDAQTVSSLVPPPKR